MEWLKGVPDLETKYAAARGPNDPATLEAYLSQTDPHRNERWAMKLAPQLMNHAGFGQLLNNMHWFVRRVPPAAGRLLTSDRPICMSWTLTEQHAYLFLPIGAHSMFVAVNDDETRRIVEERDPAQQVEGINASVAGRAVKYVYASDDTQLEFVQQHMGKMPRKTLIEKLVERRMQTRNVDD